LSRVVCGMVQAETSTLKQMSSHRFRKTFIERLSYLENI
jgi:hypothetical protein